MQLLPSHNNTMNDYGQTSLTGISSSTTSTCNSAATMAAAAAAHFYQQQQHLHAVAAAMDHNPSGHHHQPLAAAAAVAAAAVGSVDTPRYPWMSITGERRKKHFYGCVPPPPFTQISLIPKKLLHPPFLAFFLHPHTHTHVHLHPLYGLFVLEHVCVT